MADGGGGGGAAPPDPPAPSGAILRVSWLAAPGTVDVLEASFGLSGVWLPVPADAVLDPAMGRYGVLVPPEWVAEMPGPILFRVARRWAK